MGYGPEPGPTLKKALCHTRPVGGTEDKYHRLLKIIIIIIIPLKFFFFIPALADGFPQIEWQQISSNTLLNILAHLSSAVVWMISTCPLIYKSSSSFTNPLRIDPSIPITIGITVTFIFHSIFLVFSRGIGSYLSFRFL